MSGSGRVNMRFEPSGGLSGKLRAPADKSISHRAALLGAMASEPVRIERYLHAADTTSTLEAVQALGALVEIHDEEVVVRGTGLREAREPDGPIDVGNAGTLLRLLPGWLAAQEGCSVHARRRRVDPPPPGGPDRRPAAPDGRRCCTPATGASRRCRCAARGCARSPTSSTTASAQVKSCILLAALAADGATTVGEPARSRDHTERMLLQRRRLDPSQRAPRHRRQQRRAAARQRAGPRRSELRRLPDHRRRARAGLAPADLATWASTGPARASCASCAACAASCWATSSPRLASCSPMSP